MLTLANRPPQAFSNARSRSKLRFCDGDEDFTPQGGIREQGG